MLNAINISAQQIVSYLQPSTYLIMKANMGFCWHALLAFFHSLLSKVGGQVIFQHFTDRFAKYSISISCRRKISL
jgi:hypothetical protein